MLRKIRKMLQQQEGFTLVELMIVVVILGILAGIGIQQYGNVQTRARTTAHNANVRIIESAAQMYIMAEPDPETEDIDDLIPTYLREVPENPLGEDEYSLKIEKIEGDFAEGFTVTVTPPAIGEGPPATGEDD